MHNTKAEFHDYAGFVSKFKQKKTTDDCYTPPAIYQVVSDYVRDHYGKDPACFVRPFYPGGDYEHYEYAADSVVVDNPPFSILKKILTFYQTYKIPFFLFCGTLTACAALRGLDGLTVIICGVGVTYENGAIVNTSFVTNLPDPYILRTDPWLYKKLKGVQVNPSPLPKYDYPNYIATGADIAHLARYGVDYGVRRGEGVFVARMDAQQETKKTIFGGGLLVSEQAAAERAAAERAAAERKNKITWELSEREKEIIKELSK